MMDRRGAPAGTPLWVWGLVVLCVASAAAAAYVGWQARVAKDEAALRMQMDGAKPPLPSHAASASGSIPKAKAATP